MNLASSSASRNSTAESCSGQPSPASTSHRPVDEGGRHHFETCLSQQEGASTHLSEGKDERADDLMVLGSPAPQQQVFGRTCKPGKAGRADDRGALSSMETITRPFADLPPASLASPIADIQVPTSLPVFHAAPSQPSRLYAHMALPLAPGNMPGRFEVLDPVAAAMVPHLELNSLPQGGLAVDVLSSAPNAGLMAPHLPQLQRRLAGKGSAHLRIQESDSERH